jgi:ornithine carbamoyltransferase
VPVVNLLSEQGHPLQALADLLTLESELGPLAGRRLAYVGDGNNVARSLALAAGMVGMEVWVASPPDYQFDVATIERFALSGADVHVTTRPEEAVAGADAVYTDVWASMGQETEAEERERDFEGFGVDDRLMGLAASSAIFLHCLPAHRGQEVAGSVVDGPQSRVWIQAANRMHAARGALAWLLSPEGA